MNIYKYLWAQWGILNSARYKITKSHFGDLKNGWEKINIPFLVQIGFGAKKAERIFEIKSKINQKELFSKIEKLKITVLEISEEAYPNELRNIPDPPPFLWVRGQLPYLLKTIGIVGTRKITQYGKRNTERFTQELAQNQFTIISGLAMGIDSVAHSETIKNNGITIAVLGSGVDKIYPRCNENLAQKILTNKGCIVSEYPLGTRPLKHHFPARNRIISGLSKGVLVVEGGVKSGALITAKFALEQGREVFAIPSMIYQNCLSGTNQLIRKGEAKLIEKTEHILEEFQFKNQTQANDEIPKFTQDENLILKEIKNGPTTIEDIIFKTPFSLSEISVHILNLQLKGVIHEVDQKWMLA